MVFNLKPPACISQLEYSCGFSLIPASEVRSQPQRSRPAERLCPRGAGQRNAASRAASTAFTSLTRLSYRG